MCTLVRFSCKLMLSVSEQTHSKALTVAKRKLLFPTSTSTILLLFCCQLTSLQWGSMDEDESQRALDIWTVSLWCYLKASLHMHLPLVPLVPNLLSIALLSCCIWQGVTWLISETPFSVVLPLEFNTVWGEAWYQQKHETVFGLSHTASINWLTPPVLLCREFLNILSSVLCTMGVRMLSSPPPKVIPTMQSRLVCSSSPGHKRICGISLLLQGYIFHYGVGRVYISFSRLVNSEFLFWPLLWMV